MSFESPNPHPVPEDEYPNGAKPIKKGLAEPGVIDLPSQSSSSRPHTFSPPPPRHPRSYVPATLNSLDGANGITRFTELDHSAVEQQHAWAGPRPTVAATKGPLPSIVFAIPFPNPAPHVQTTDKTPAFLLYCFPRANYEKPGVGPDGKRNKEGLVKKVERMWQEEVQQGADVKKGKIKHPSGWQRFKGKATGLATRVIKWLPDSSIETLGRLPPGKKIGFVTVVYPHEIDEVRNDSPPRTSQEIKDGLDKILHRTRKRAITKTTISAITLPITAAIDFFCVVPLFLFEINIVYFSLQVNGARKVGTLSRANNRGNKPVKAKKKKRGLKDRFKRQPKAVAPQENETSALAEEQASPEEQLPAGEQAMETGGQDHEHTTVNIFNVQKSRPHVFQPILAHLYSVCSQLDRGSFPVKPQSESYQTPSYIPTPAMVHEFIRSFREWVPEDVALRHNLDANVVAEDLGRCLRKASKEYIRSLKGRTGQKFTI